MEKGYRLLERIELGEPKKLLRESGLPQAFD